MMTFSYCEVRYWRGFIEKTCDDGVIVLTNVSADAGSISDSSSVRMLSSEFTNSSLKMSRLKYFQNRFDIVIYLCTDDDMSVV